VSMALCCVVLRCVAWRGFFCLRCETLHRPAASGVACIPKALPASSCRHMSLMPCGRAPTCERLFAVEQHAVAHKDLAHPLPANSTAQHGTAWCAQHRQGADGSRCSKLPPCWSTAQRRQQDMATPACLLPASHCPLPAARCLHLCLHQASLWYAIHTLFTLAANNPHHPHTPPGHAVTTHPTTHLATLSTSPLSTVVPLPTVRSYSICRVGQGQDRDMAGRAGRAGAGKAMCCKTGMRGWEVTNEERAGGWAERAGMHRCC